MYIVCILYVYYVYSMYIICISLHIYIAKWINPNFQGFLEIHHLDDELWKFGSDFGISANRRKFERGSIGRKSQRQYPLVI